jgi:hypothetical protein
MNLVLQITNLISRSGSYLWTLEHDVDLPLGQAPLLQTCFLITYFETLNWKKHGSIPWLPITCYVKGSMI